MALAKLIIKEHFDKLNPTEQKVLELRFGNALTYQEIAFCINRSKSRAVMITKIALEKLQESLGLYNVTLDTKLELIISPYHRHFYNCWYQRIETVRDLIKLGRQGTTHIVESIGKMKTNEITLILAVCGFQLAE